jgi:hypothetical protein
MASLQQQCKLIKQLICKWFYEHLRNFIISFRNEIQSHTEIDLLVIIIHLNPHPQNIPTPIITSSTNLSCTSFEWTNSVITFTDVSWNRFQTYWKIVHLWATWLKPFSMYLASLLHIVLFMSDRLGSLQAWKRTGWLLPFGTRLTLLGENGSSIQK